MKKSQIYVVFSVLGLVLAIAQAFFKFGEFQIGLISPLRYFLFVIGPLLVTTAMFIQWRKNVANGSRD